MTPRRPPFDPYSERREASDPTPTLRRPWDGCWTWTIARAIDGATGGKIAGLDEHDIRKACGKPDRPGADAGTSRDQIVAVRKLAPGLWFKWRPSLAQFRAHLAAGGIAVMAGSENNAPPSDRAYDRHMYDRGGAHSNFAQGRGDGSTIWWGNPEKFRGWPEPVVSIDAAVKFTWPISNGRVEAVLFRSATEGDDEMAIFAMEPGKVRATLLTPEGQPAATLAAVDQRIRALTETGASVVPTSHFYDVLGYKPDGVPGHTEPCWFAIAEGQPIYLLCRNAAAAIAS